MTMPANTVTSSVTIAAAFSGDNVKSFFIRAPQAFARNIGSREVCIPPTRGAWLSLEYHTCGRMPRSFYKFRSLHSARLFSGNIEIPMSTTPKPPVTGANGGLTPDAGCVPHSFYIARRRHQCGLANSDAFRVHVGGAGYCLDRCSRALRIRREVEDAAGCSNREAFVAVGGYSADITQ